MSPAKNPVLSPVQITFPNGVQLLTFIRDEIHHIICDQCGQEIVLTSGGVPTSIYRHRGAKPCKMNQKLKRHDLSTGHSRQTSISGIEFSLANLSTSSTITEPVLGPCPGALIAWKPGSIWDTYCYQIHAMRDVGWEPVAFKTETNEICLRADRCTGNTVGSRSCFACLSIETSRSYRDFVERAFNVKDHTPWKYLHSR